MNKFHIWAFQNFPFMEETFKEIDNYHLMMQILHYLKEQLKDYRELVKEVEDLENWFNDLDVQEEINNKLEEMVESGELQEIISQYLNSTAIFGFDTVADMKSATNLIDGSNAKTLGFYTLNDGGGATYKIRNITNSDVVDEEFIISLYDDSLVAELIVENVLNLKTIGAKNDMSEDIGTKINNAITRGYKNIYIPKGKYLVSTTIDLVDKVNIDISGEMYGTYKSNTDSTILCGNTGSYPLFNLIGGGFITLKNFLILSDDIELDHPSTLGILQGCSTNREFSQWIHFENLHINLVTSDTANNNNGSIGIYNWQSELNNYLNVFAYADIPVYLTRDDELQIGANNGGILPAHDSLTGNNYVNLETQSKKEYTMCVGGDSATFTGFYGQGTVKILTNIRGDNQVNNLFIQGVIEKNHENTVSSTFEITPGAKIQHSIIHVTSVGHTTVFTSSSSGQVVSTSYLDIVGNMSKYSGTNIRYSNNFIMKGSLVIDNIFGQGNIVIGGSNSNAIGNTNLSILNDGNIIQNGRSLCITNTAPTTTSLPNQSIMLNGANNNFVAYKYDGNSSSWKPFGIGVPIESDTGSISSQTPAMIGQLLHDVTTNDMYIAYGTSQGNWKKITP